MTMIRPMAPDDIPQVERLIKAATAVREQETGAAPGGQAGSRLVQNRFQKDPGGCFVADDPAHGLVGAVLSIAWGSVAWLGPLAAHPEFRGKGLEPQLLQAVLDHWEPMSLSVQGVEADPA